MVEDRLERGARQPAGGFQERIEREGDVARLLLFGPIDQPHARAVDDQPEGDAGLVEQPLELLLGRFDPGVSSASGGLRSRSTSGGDLQPEKAPARAVLGRLWPAIGEAGFERVVDWVSSCRSSAGGSSARFGIVRGRLAGEHLGAGAGTKKSSRSGFQPRNSVRNARVFGGCAAGSRDRRLRRLTGASVWSGLRGRSGRRRMERELDLGGAEGVRREDQAERDRLEVVEPEVMGIERPIIRAGAARRHRRGGTWSGRSTSRHDRGLSRELRTGVKACISIPVGLIPSRARGRRSRRAPAARSARRIVRGCGRALRGSRVSMSSLRFSMARLS